MIEIRITSQKLIEKKINFRKLGGQVSHNQSDLFSFDIFLLTLF